MCATSMLFLRASAFLVGPWFKMGKHTVETFTIHRRKLISFKKLENYSITSVTPYFIDNLFNYYVKVGHYFKIINLSNIFTKHSQAVVNN